MNTRDKYLHQLKAEWLRDSKPLSDADLDNLFGEVTNCQSTGTKADPARSNPHALTATGLTTVVSAIIDKKQRQLTALVGLFDLDGDSITQTITAIGDSADPVTAIYEAVEVELSRRGLVARALTKWLLDNVLSLTDIAERNGWDKARLAEEVVAHLHGNNPEYAQAVELYFGEDDADKVELCLLACCVLLALDYEATAERAGIYEYDAGMTRTRATISATVNAIRERQPRLSEIMARCFFDLSSKAMELEHENGWSRQETGQWICDRLDSVPADVPLKRPTSARRAG